MALHPEVIQKAHIGMKRNDEIHFYSLIGIELDKVVGLDRLPSWEDQAFLPYVRSLIKELHRCCGVGGLGT